MMVLIATRSANIPQFFPALFVQEEFLDEWICLAETSFFPTEETVRSAKEDDFTGDAPGDEKEDSRLAADISTMKIELIRIDLRSNQRTWAELHKN